MERAIFATPFEDFDYEKWAAACGCSFIKLEPVEGGGFELHLEGAAGAIECFAKDIGWSPVG